MRLLGTPEVAAGNRGQPQAERVRLAARTRAVATQAFPRARPQVVQQGAMWWEVRRALAVVTLARQAAQRVPVLQVA